MATTARNIRPVPVDQIPGNRPTRKGANEGHADCRDTDRTGPGGGYRTIGRGYDLRKGFAVDDPAIGARYGIERAIYVDDQEVGWGY